MVDVNVKDSRELTRLRKERDKLMAAIVSVARQEKGWLLRCVKIHNEEMIRRNRAAGCRKWEKRNRCAE
jgi:hypothetical protein